MWWYFCCLSLFWAAQFILRVKVFADELKNWHWTNMLVWRERSTTRNDRLRSTTVHLYLLVFTTPYRSNTMLSELAHDSNWCWWCAAHVCWTNSAHGFVDISHLADWTLLTHIPHSICSSCRTHRQTDSRADCNHFSTALTHIHTHNALSRLILSFACMNGIRHRIVRK